MIVDAASFTSAGGFEINEDSFFCGEGVFAVADGLGGHADGEKASAEAVRYLKENCRGGYTAESINEILEGANSAVRALECEARTTVAAAFIEGKYFQCANAGDSRVYYFKKGSVALQTKDHSVCQASVDMGLMSSDEIRGNEDRSRLLKVLGSSEKLNLKKSYEPVEISSGDAFLVCSDGFWEYVTETEMEADLLKSDTAEKWMRYMLKRHLLASENKGDNYTLICGFMYRTAEDDAVPFPVSEKKPEPEETAAAEALPAKNPGKSKKTPVIFAAVIVLLLLAAGLFAWSRLPDGVPAEDISEVTKKSETETTKKTHKTTETEKTVTEPQKTVTESQKTVTEPQETVTEPQKAVTEPKNTTSETSVTKPEDTKNVKTETAETTVEKTAETADDTTAAAEKDGGDLNG